VNTTTTTNCKERNRSNPVNLKKRAHVNNAIYLRFQMPGGDLFLLLAGGGEEEDEECEDDSASSEHHRFTGDAVVPAALV
jgi:hypothetical protein